MLFTSAKFLCNRIVNLGFQSSADGSKASPGMSKWDYLGLCFWEYKAKLQKEVTGEDAGLGPKHPKCKQKFCRYSVTDYGDDGLCNPPPYAIGDTIDVEKGEDACPDIKTGTNFV